MMLEPEYLGYFKRTLKKTCFFSVENLLILMSWIRIRIIIKILYLNHGKKVFIFLIHLQFFFHFCKNYLQKAVMVQTRKNFYAFSKKKKLWCMSTLNFVLGNCSNFVHLCIYFFHFYVPYLFQDSTEFVNRSVSIL